MASGSGLPSLVPPRQSNVGLTDTSSNLPVGLHVKNTFLDLTRQTSGDCDSENWDDLDVYTLPRRIVTEPPPTRVGMMQEASSASSGQINVSSNLAPRDECEHAGDSVKIASVAAGNDGRREQDENVVSTSSRQHSAEQQHVPAESSSSLRSDMGNEMDSQVTMSNLQTRVMTLAAQIAARMPATSSRVSDWGDAPLGWESITTVMMTWLPHSCNRQILLDVFNADGFAGTFDFLHLPRNSTTPVNEKNCLVNFVDPCFAWLFKLTYDRKNTEGLSSETLVYIKRATIQGFDANVAYFTHDNCRDPSERPILFREAVKTMLEKPVNCSREPPDIGTSLIDSEAQKQSVSQLDQLTGMASAQAKMQTSPQDTSVSSGHAHVKKRAGKVSAARKGSAQSLPRASQRTAAAHHAMAAPHDPDEHFGKTPRPRFCVYCGGDLGKRLPASKVCSHCGRSLSFI